MTDLQRRRRWMTACVGAGVLIACLMLTREGGVEAAAPPVAGSRETATLGSAAHVLSPPVARTL
ncbi:MAG TPA: hypothetical protein VN201_05795, partial [Roseateles sp.]|nr:hypothetical protein [Roseateles sp.]